MRLARTHPTEKEEPNEIKSARELVLKVTLGSNWEKQKSSHGILHRQLSKNEKLMCDVLREYQLAPI